MPGLFNRRQGDPQQRQQDPGPSLKAATSPASPEANRELEVFGKELFQGFVAKEGAARADRQAELARPAWKRDLDSAVSAMKEGMPPIKIELARDNLSPREEVAGQQLAIHQELQGALATAAPAAVSADQALRAKGALAMTQVAMSLPVRDRSSWFGGAQEQAMRLERTLETLPARLQHRRLLGLDEASLRAEQERELDGVAGGLQDIGLRGLPRELHAPSPSILLGDPIDSNPEARRESLQAYVQGVRFSLEEGGRETMTTARDVMRGATAEAARLREDPSVSPYLTLDRKVLGAFTKVRDAMLDDPRNGAQVTAGNQPKLEASLGQIMDPALAKTISASTAASAGQLYESREVRDMALFLNGDPAYLKPETHEAARQVLGQSNNQLSRYREVATTMMDSPVDALPQALQEFQQAALDLELVQPGATAALAAAGWGPLAVIAASAKVRPSATEVRDAVELARSMEKGGLGDGYTRAFSPGSKTYMLPSEQPGQDPKLAHISNNGRHARVYGFEGGEPRMLFEGPIAAAPVQEKVRDLLVESGSVLTQPQGRIKLAQAGVVDLQAMPVPQYGRTPWLVDPLFQAPALRDLQPIGNAAPVEALDRNALREAAARQ
jgi:hypothetical protein